MTDRDKIEQRIRDLIQMLTSPAGEYGDWKIIKYTEYVAAGKPAPYDMTELHLKRQEMRDEIERLQKELEELDC